MFIVPLEQGTEMVQAEEVITKRSLTCFCDGLNIDSKSIRQVTKDVVKSEF